jgi:hypothetical protein
MLLEPGEMLGQTIQAPLLSGLLLDQVDENARIDEVVIKNEIVGVLDTREVMCAVQYTTISSTPNVALTRTMRPTSSDSPMSRCPYATRSVMIGAHVGVVNTA